MPLQSDLTLDTSKFDPAAVSQKTKDFNERLIEIMSGIPPWYEVGAQRYREMRANGETPLPAPKGLPHATVMTVPSRESGRNIPCRVLKPRGGAASKGVFYHIHGGGWVLQDEASQDPLLAFIADTFSLTVLSVGYRLAPEHPFPAGPEDCYDVAEWLVDNAEAQFGVPMLAAGGESAGGHLTTLTCFHLQQTRPSFAFEALLLSFAVFDLSTLLPQAKLFQKPLVLTGKIMEKYIEALLPHTTATDRTSPTISPFYADLINLKLPPALFTCGTEDPLLDDSVLMAARWQMAGGVGVLKIYPGAPHGFCMFEPGMIESVDAWRKDVGGFMGEFL